MRIINLEDREAQDIEAPLRSLASSHDRLEAFKGRKLLELVRHLQAQGPAPEVIGRLWWRQQLLLTPRSTTNRAAVTVWIDWRDYAPVRDGLPEAHYRLQIRRGNAALSQDARAATPEEVERIIWEAFGWVR
jgi:hypothetical protein